MLEMLSGTLSQRLYEHKNSAQYISEKMQDNQLNHKLIPALSLNEKL